MLGHASAIRYLLSALNPVIIACMDVDIELYRREVPIAAQLNTPTKEILRLSAIDIAPDHAHRTLVFVHGYGGHAGQWKHQLRYFSDVARTIAIDLRGHGLSDAPHTHYDMASIVSDIHAALAVLDVREKFVLVGHSFGVAIASEYAHAHPERVEKLILIAGAGAYRLEPTAQFALSLPLSVLQVMHVLYTHTFLHAPPHVIRAMFHDAVAKWDGWELFKGLSMPTLVIRGHRDRVLKARDIEEVTRAIPNAEEVDMGATAHMVMLERPDATNRAIERFIAGKKGHQVGDEDRRRMRQERVWLDHYGQNVPYTIGLPSVPMYRMLRLTARRFPGQPAIFFQGTRLNYWRLNQESSRLANFLTRLGLKPGDRVLLLLPNLPQTVIAYYGILKLGGVVVFTTPLSAPDELARQVRHSKARAVITLTRLADTMRQVKQQTDLEFVIFTNVKDYLPEPQRFLFTLTREAKEGHRLPFAPEPGMYLLANELYKYSPHAPEVETHPDDLALIQYTSGTTAQPKGVMLSHRNLMANALQTRHWLPELKEGQERFLSVIPLSHAYGMTAAMNVPVALGAAMIIQPAFITQEVLAAIKRYRPTIFPGVPSMYVNLTNAPGVRNYGISSIKACVSGAAPLPVEVQEAFEKLTKGRLVEGYGQSEATTVTHANPLSGRRKLGKIGVPLPSTEAKVVDLVTGKDVPPGQLGELAVRGPQVALGYWDGEQRQPLPETREGWLLTGDLARMDEDGYFEVVARKRDMILAGDYQVYPRDVEEVLYEHPNVKEVAVVGVQPPRWPFQRVKAFVVPQAGSTLKREELMALCKRRLEEYAVPWEIEFRTELPKNFMGKVLRRLLVEPGGAEDE